MSNFYLCININFQYIHIFGENVKKHVFWPKISIKITSRLPNWISTCRKFNSLSYDTKYMTIAYFNT